MSNYKIGDKIIFKRELIEIESGDHPTFIYARKGETGEITEVGGCLEGYWVKTDTWKTPFGCEDKDFMLRKV